MSYSQADEKDFIGLTVIFHVSRRSGAAQVFAAVAGVDLQHLAVLDEQRHLQHQAGLEGGGLGGVRGGITLEAGLGVGRRSSAAAR